MINNHLQKAMSYFKRGFKGDWLGFIRIACVIKTDLKLSHVGSSRGDNHNWLSQNDEMFELIIALIA